MNCEGAAMVAGRRAEAVKRSGLRCGVVAGLRSSAGCPTTTMVGGRPSTPAFSTERTGTGHAEGVARVYRRSLRSSASSVPARLGQNRGRESRLVGESLRIATVGGNGSRTVVAARHRAEIAGGRCRRARNRRRRSIPCPGCGRGAGPLEHRLPIVGRVAAAGRRKRSCPIADVCRFPADASVEHARPYRTRA